MKNPVFHIAITGLTRLLLLLLLFTTTPPLMGIGGCLQINTLHERIYLQTDKRLYLSGEQIQLKLSTVDTAYVPLIFSKVAYVELVDDSIAHIQIIIALPDGTGVGMMQLPADLPTGTYRLIAYTQFMRNEESAPFCEKIIGVFNPFTPPLKGAGGCPIPPLKGAGGCPELNLHPNKLNYQTREQGELILSGLPDNIHTLAVSITGKDIIAIEGLRPELDSGTSAMTVEGNPSVKHLPEYVGHIIKGKIIDNQTGKPVSGKLPITAGLSFPGEGIRFFSGQITDAGDVLFYTSGITGTNRMATVVYNANEKYHIDIQSPFITRFPPQIMPALVIDTSFFSQLIDRSVALQASHYFMDDPFEQRIFPLTTFNITPTNSYLLDEYTRFTTMREVFIEFILGARFRRRAGQWELSALINMGAQTYYGNKPLVLLDGAPISNHELILNYDPLLVERINIYNSQYSFGGENFDGIIELKTYRGLMQDVAFDKSTQIIPYEGPQSFAAIPVPDYSTGHTRKNRIPDSRHTLLWAPNVQTNGQQTLRIPFNTSALSGEFQASVEVLTKDGKVIYATTLFTVTP